MANDLDIYRTLNIMIQQQGDEALKQAAMKANDFTDLGSLVTKGSDFTRTCPSHLLGCGSRARLDV